jgi:hypothetical protein
VAAKTQAIIGDLPAEQFINRRVKLRSNDGDQHPIQGRLLQVSGFRAVVRTENSSNDTITTVDRVLPWWSQNADLKKMRDDAVAAKQKENAERNRERIRALEELATPDPVMPPPQPITPPPPMPAAPAVELPPLPPPAKKPVQGTKFTMEVSGTADPRAWQPLLTKWIELDLDEQSALALLEETRTQRIGVARDLMLHGVHLITAKTAPLTGGALTPDSFRDIYEDMVIRKATVEFKTLRLLFPLKESATAQDYVNLLENGLKSFCPAGHTYKVTVQPGLRNAKSFAASVWKTM